MIFIFVVVVIASVMLYNYFFSKAAVINRKLKKAPLKKIAAFQDGEVAKVIGKIVFVDEPLLAPLTNRACSYFKVLVEVNVSSGKSSHWKTLIEEVKATRIVIFDGEDYALINHQNIKPNIIFDKEANSGTFNDATPILENYLKKHGEKSTGTFGLNKKMRYQEGVLEKNEQISALGKGQWQSTESLGLPLDKVQILVLSATADDAIYVSDDPETTVKTPPKAAKKISESRPEKPVEKPRIPAPKKAQRKGRYLKD